jgi:Tol biopolymer transport system component
MPAVGGEAKRLTFDKTYINGITWSTDGKSIVFASRRAGGMSLWKVSVSGGAAEPLAVGGSSATHPAFSPRGDMLAYTQGNLHPDIWRMEVSRATGRNGPPARFISSTVVEGTPQYSPDGGRIAFYSGRSGNPEIWVCNSECSDPVQLTSLGVLSGTPRWSPDGKQIAFDSRPAEHGEILVINADGGVARTLTSGTAENWVPSWSRNGRWIYFASNRSEAWQVWKVPVAGGDAVQVTKNGGFIAFESADGKFVYYTKDDGPGIWRVPPDGGDEVQVLDACLASTGDWAVLDTGIYFVNNKTSPRPTIDLFDFASRRTSTIATLPGPLPPEMPDLAVSPDGRWILYTQVQRAVDIMLVENFR